MIIPFKELTKGLEDQLSTSSIITSDYYYETVSEMDIKLADHKAYMTWMEESWDCDDQVVALLYILRKKRYGKKFPPAAGRMSAVCGGINHALIWFVNHSGVVRYYDATQREFIERSEFSNVKHVIDK